MRPKDSLIKSYYARVYAHNNTNLIMKIFFMLFTAMMLAGLARAQQADSGKNFVNVNDQGVILDGYDAVAFFTDNKPVKGDAQFQATYGGATYYFASKEHAAEVLTELAKKAA